MRWIDNFASFDVETTGFGSDARIIEVSVVHWLRGRHAGAWSTFLNPPGLDWDNPNVQKSLAVNKIEPAMVAHAPTFADVATELMHELGAGIWVAHNAPFDVRMLEQEFRALATPMPWRAGLVVDTCALARKIDGAHKMKPGYKLDEIALRYGVLQGTAHRAETDATACGQILLRMGDKIPLRARELGAFLDAS